MKSLTKMIFLLAFSTTFGQPKYDPNMLILSPHTRKYEPAFKKEISAINQILKNNSIATEIEKATHSDEFSNQPQNFKLIVESEIDYAKRLDAFNQISFQTEQILVYYFSKKFHSLLIKLKDTNCNGEISELKKMAEKENYQYVLNFPAVEFYKKDNMSYAKVAIQLYDNVSNALLLNKSYTGNWRNPGLEFSCKDSSISCTLNNVLSASLEEIIELITANSLTVKKEKELKTERADILDSKYFKYYEAAFDKEELKNIIAATDTTVDVNNAYQVIFNENKTKFVAFFLKQYTTENFKTLKDNESDPNNNTIEIENYEYQANGYGYIVHGVQYNKRWYYEKSNVVELNVKPLATGKQKLFGFLQQWNFFKEESTVPNPDFWETKLFEKVPDLTKDPRWEKNKASMQTEEVNLRPYFGLYQIIANQLKRQKIDFANKKEKEILDAYITPLENKLKTQNNYETVSRFHRFNRDKGNDCDCVFLYPSDFKVILCPIEAKDKDKNISYFFFVLIQQENDTYKLYEWTYLKNPNLLVFFDEMNKVTFWNYGISTLDDNRFWNDYVLLKNGDTFKYLKDVK